MKRRLGFVGALAALFLTFATTAGASTILLSATGALGTDPNAVVRFLLVNPSLGNVTIQTYGYGGSANAPGGKNGAGAVIPGGGFDPVVGLFAGPIGGNGAQLGFNDDGICAPGFGATSGGVCFDSTFTMLLAPGTYTVTLSVFAHFPGATENVAFTGGGSFTDVNQNVRTPNYAVDVFTNAAVPEPATLALLSTGLLALGFTIRRRRA